ncbi:MAG: hypothetical protein ACYC21_09740 [Eubacteriales bacterium]
MGNLIELPLRKRSKAIRALPDAQVDGSFTRGGVTANISSCVSCFSPVAAGTVTGLIKYLNAGDLDFIFTSQDPFLLVAQQNNGLSSMGTVFTGVILAERNSSTVITTDGILHLTATRVKGGWFGSYILVWLQETAPGVREVMRLVMYGRHTGNVAVNREVFWQSPDEAESDIICLDGDFFDGGTFNRDFLNRDTSENPIYSGRQGIVFAGAVDGFLDDKGVSADISSIVRHKNCALAGNVRGSIRAFKVNGSWEFWSVNPVAAINDGEGTYPDYFLGHSVGAIFNKVNVNNQTRDCTLYLTTTQVQTNPAQVPGNAWFGSYVIVTPDGRQFMIYGRFPGLALKSTNNFCVVL